MLIPIFVSSPSSPRTPSLDDRELKTFNAGLLAFYKLCIPEYLPGLDSTCKAKITKEQLFGAFHQSLDYLLKQRYSQKDLNKLCFRSHKKMLPAEICGCCVSFFERATLDDKGVPYKRFIHPRIWESGDPNYPACNADLVGRAAWLFYPLVMMPQEEVSENLKSVMDEMNVYEQILVDTKRGRLIVNNKLNVILGASV